MESQTENGTDRILYLFEMKDETKQVVDGRQRITAILDFLNNKQVWY